MDLEMMNQLQEFVLGFLGIGLSFMALFIIYKAIQLKNQEKMALIEKGMEPSLADVKPKSTANNFKIGLMLIGIALGVVFGYLLHIILLVPEFVSYSTMILVFCGGLLIYFHKSESAK
ncbi:MAG: DUF6249 domain-containing protein [Candidatus Cyclobacteriaceae bacterium M3_2C_046]